MAKERETRLGSSGLEATFGESPFDPQCMGGVVLRGRSGKLSRQASVLLGSQQGLYLTSIWLLSELDVFGVYVCVSIKRQLSFHQLYTD